MGWANSASAGWWSSLDPGTPAFGLVLGLRWIFCPSHRHRRLIASRGFRGGDHGLSARAISWGRWSTKGPARFCWWSKPFLPIRINHRWQWEELQRVSWQRPSSTYPSSSSFYHDLQHQNNKQMFSKKVDINLTLNLYIIKLF